MRHAGPLGLFAALTIGWTWPLAAHLGTALPGAPGDNYSFLWDLWWVRTALETPGLPYFRTNYLFYPFGIDMVGQSHIALPGLAAATILRPLTLAAANNTMVLAFVFANMACAYALAWDLTRNPRASVAAAVVFGLSPYLGAHLVGHFELMAAWPLPLFALLMRRSLDGSRAAAFGAAALAVATAYTTYYYVIYLGLFAIVYVTADFHLVTISRSRRTPTRELIRVRQTLLAGAALLAAMALWIVTTGGGQTFGVSMTRPQNPLTAMWALLIAWALCAWRPTVRIGAAGGIDAAWRRVASVAAVLTVVFLAGTAPLLVEAARVAARGEYVSQTYSWRSAPRGVDAITPFVGPPSHPLVRDALHRLYASANIDVVEAVGWMGIVPLLIAFGVSGDADAPRRLRTWWTVAAVFGLLALGPYFTVLGIDTGLRLPEILLRFVPIVSNARMPGRMMVVVFTAIVAIVALRLSGARGRLASPGVQWTLITLIVFECWDAPIPITVVDRPAVYEALAQQPPGAVCEVPFGIGDGLTVGIGSRERSVLYYATIHRHPLVGGVVSRMPVDATARYERMAVVGDLLRLSDGRDAVAPSGPEPSPCTYLVVRDSELSPALRSYLRQLPLQSIATGEGRELFVLRKPVQGR